MNALNGPSATVPETKSKFDKGEFKRGLLATVTPTAKVVGYFSILPVTIGLAIPIACAAVSGGIELLQLVALGDTSINPKVSTDMMYAFALAATPPLFSAAVISGIAGPLSLINAFSKDAYLGANSHKTLSYRGGAALAGAALTTMSPVTGIGALLTLHAAAPILP